MHTTYTHVLTERVHGLYQDNRAGYGVRHAGNCFNPTSNTFARAQEASRLSRQVRCLRNSKNELASRLGASSSCIFDPQRWTGG